MSAHFVLAENFEVGHEDGAEDVQVEQFEVEPIEQISAEAVEEEEDEDDIDKYLDSIE